MELELPVYQFCPQCGAPVEVRYREGRNRPLCTVCGYVIYVNPVPAAALVLLDKGKVLLTLRDVDPHRGEWCLPGGFIEWGENPEKAAQRELLEETGITAKVLSLLGVYDTVADTGRHIILIVYSVLSWTGEPVAGDDAREVMWFDTADIPSLAFTVHEQALADALKRIQSEQ